MRIKAVFSFLLLRYCGKQVCATLPLINPGTRVNVSDRPKVKSSLFQQNPLKGLALQARNKDFVKRRT